MLPILANLANDLSFSIRSKTYITSNYIGAYPLAKMLEYNHYLLNEKSKESTPVVDKKALLEMLKGLSEEERTELMANLSD